MVQVNIQIVICISILIGVGAVIPYVDSYLGTPTSVANSVDLVRDNSQIGLEEGFSDQKGTIKNILKMFFWTFGLLPWWLDLMFWIIRLWLYLLLLSKLPFIGTPQ